MLKPVKALKAVCVIKKELSRTSTANKILAYFLLRPSAQPAKQQQHKWKKQTLYNSGNIG